jgi:pyruvate dehydrogenase E1 component
MSEKLLVPDIGDFEEVEVIEVLAKQGDQLNINDPVITIESDKSSVEIPSTIAGKIEKVEVKVGDKVSKGDLILNIVSSGENKKDNPIPKDTESIIKQAEAAMAEKKDELKFLSNHSQKKNNQLFKLQMVKI